MRKFEQAILDALATIPENYWQREDGLLCEKDVRVLEPHWFPNLRLRMLEWQGLIESRKGYYLSKMIRSYRLVK